METDIRIIDVVDSTNITLGEMADAGAKEGTCVVSFCQRHGQGRSGRTFFSPEGGNLYMSLLLRPKKDSDTDMITVCAAVAATESVNDLFGINAGIKWVNDIIYNGRKIGGIVAQARNFGTEEMYVILGIGINICESTDVPSDIEDRYGSITQKAPDMPKEELNGRAVSLARMIIGKFAEAYEDDPKADVIDRYRNLSVVIGRTVEYVSGSRRQKAKVCGIDDDGGIILETGENTSSFRDGEIRINLA